MLPATNDSEQSTRSTFAFECHKSLDQQLQVQPCLPQQRQRKLERVRFDESRNQSFANRDEGRSSEECVQTWYQSKDYKIMRNNMRRHIQDLKKKEQNSIHQDQKYTVSEILQTLLKLVTSIDYEVLHPSTILNDEAKHMICQLYSRGPESMELIGLEMHLESKLRRAAKEHRDQIQDTVYNIQKDHMAGILSDTEVTNELRDCCLNFSQPFGLLAQLRASAQLSAESMQWPHTISIHGQAQN